MKEFTQQTVVLVKPDGVKRGLVGEIISRFERVGLKIVAAPGTIRGDYSVESAMGSNLDKRSTRNLMHASGSSEEAKFEMKLWFKNSEIYKYKRVEESL